MNCYANIVTKENHIIGGLNPNTAMKIVNGENVEYASCLSQIMAVLVGYCGSDQVMYETLKSRYANLDETESNIDLSPIDLLAGLPATYGILYLPAEFPRGQGIYSSSLLT